MPVVVGTCSPLWPGLWGIVGRLAGTVTGGASAGGELGAAAGAGVACWAAAVAPIVTVDVVAGTAEGPSVAGATVVLVVVDVLAEICTGSIWPGAGGTVDASARVNPSAAPATRSTAAAKLRGRARTGHSLPVSRGVCDEPAMREHSNFPRPERRGDVPDGPARAGGRAERGGWG